MIQFDRAVRVFLGSATICALLAAVGCQGGGESGTLAAGAAASSPLDAKDPLNVPPPLSDAMQETELGLFRKSSQVSIGSNPEDALKLFRNAQSGFESEVLPPHFQPPYKSRIWDGADESFGVITFDGKVIQAMDQAGASQTTVDGIVANYTERLRALGEPKIVGGKSVSYWFWDTAGQRLMICAMRQPNGTVMVTQAVGIDSAMDALRMNEIRAREDQQEADQVISLRETGANQPIGPNKA